MLVYVLLSSLSLSSKRPHYVSVCPVLLFFLHLPHLHIKAHSAQLHKSFILRNVLLYVSNLLFTKNLLLMDVPRCCTPLNLLWPQKQRGWKNNIDDDKDKCINIIIRYLSMSEAMEQQCLCERPMRKHNFLQFRDIHLNVIYANEYWALTNTNF